MQRIHDAGLFAGALPNGSKRYQLRARFGDNVVDLDDPYRFPPVLTDFDLYLLGEGTHQRHLRQARRASDDARRRRRRRLRGARAECAAGQRGRRFQFLECAAASDAGARQRLLGAVRSRTPRAGDHYKFDIIGPHGQHLPLKSDPMAFAAEVRPNTASIVLDETKAAASAAGAARHQRAERADVDLRGASRLVAAQGQTTNG